MNFLERAAIRRAERRIGDAFGPNEHIVDFDVATYEGGFRIDLIATERALYTFDSRNRDVSRIAYEDIHGIDWEPGITEKRFGVILWNGRAIWAQLKGTPRGMAKYVTERVQALALIDRHLDGPEGSGATFTMRPASASGRLGWIVTPDEGTNLDAPSVSAWATEQMKAMKDEWDGARVSDVSNRQYRCEWGDSGTGVTFVFDREGKVTWNYDTNDDPEVMTDILTDQARGEIEVAYGRVPKVQYAWPRPDWMPPFVWSPPLPGCDEG